MVQINVFNLDLPSIIIGQSTMAEFDSRLAFTIEQLIRAGQIAPAQAALESINGNQIPRREIAHFANLARRSGRSELTLRWLKRYVRSTKVADGGATPREIAEYAMGLQRCGAVQEARRRLHQISMVDLPIVGFYLALCDLATWDFKSALDKLDKFINNGQFKDDYLWDLARVNRVACWVSLGMHDQASGELDLLSHKLRSEGQNFLLLANVLEITAQLHILISDLRGARLYLEEARSLIDRGLFPDQIFIRKWSSVILALESRQLEPLIKMRQEALASHHWETLRDLDYFSLLVRPEANLAQWLYYGTPYPFWRERLVKNWPDLLVEQDRSSLRWISRLENSVHRVDPLSATNGMGDLPHCFVMLLLRDFYRPSRIGEIFDALFSGQQFDETTSKNRVHAGAVRARKWLAEEGWPARIEENQGSYSLRWNAGVSLLCSQVPFPYQRETVWHQILWRKFATQSFRSAEAADVIKVSASQAARGLKAMEASNLVSRFGAGKNTQYALVSVLS